MDPAGVGREALPKAAGDATGKRFTDSFTVRAVPSAPRPNAPKEFPLQVLDNFVAEEPSAFRYAYKGAARWCLGQQDEAFDDLDEAVELDPDYVPAIVALSRCVINAELYRPAGKRLSRALALKPGYQEGYVQRVRAFMFMGRYPQALADLERAAEIDPGSTIVPRLRSNVLFPADRYAGALQVMDSAVERFQHDVDLRYHRGLIHQLCRRLDAAEQDFSHVIKEQGMPYMALMQRGAS